MKNYLLSGLILLGSLSAFSNTIEGGEISLAIDSIKRSIPIDFQSESIKINPDNSVSFSDISILRGDKAYRIGHDNNTSKEVCKLLEFDDSLTDIGLTYFFEGNGRNRNNQARIDLDSTGHYAGTSIDDDYYTKVTCYNYSELKTVVDYTEKSNPDGSSTITNIQYLRGDKAYRIGHDNNTSKEVCKLLEFDDSLTDPGLTYFFEGNGRNHNNQTRINLDSNGHYAGSSIDDDYYTKVTCYLGSDVSLIVKIGNDRFRMYK